MKKIIVFLFLVVNMFGSVLSTKDEPAVRSIGIGYSGVGGTGINYRMYDEDGYLQITGVAIYESKMHLFFGISRGDYIYERYSKDGSTFFPFAIKYHYGASVTYANLSSVTGGVGIGVEFGNPHIKGYVIELVVDYIGGYEQSNNYSYTGEILSVSKDYVLRPDFTVALNFNF